MPRPPFVVSIAAAAARDGALATGMTDGMEVSYARLDDLLGTT